MHEYTCVYIHYVAQRKRWAEHSDLLVHLRQAKHGVPRSLEEEMERLGAALSSHAAVDHLFNQDRTLQTE